MYCGSIMDLKFLIAESGKSVCLTEIEDEVKETTLFQNQEDLILLLEYLLPSSNLL